MRSDAARRRERIIREARALFAAQGGTVALETIAEASDVGIATLYRNFDSRTALADAVALAILTDMRDAAALALARIDADPQDGWHGFVTALVDLDLGALTDALAHHVVGDISGPVREAQEQTLDRIAAVLSAARAAGVVRAEIEPLELVLAIGMLTRPQPEPIRTAVPKLVPRLIAVLEAGLGA
ncbi:TetR/AcrR family transcriptional regulator [Microbacterium jiangjiandongii]|uniref:TetR/AcrR family transcriptional regulator n=1 Tax=Microbacterium jiangjiandongii TaxID=3049071 RepID=UPI00214ADD61|nr:TetR/AcrR family transcriptional regulator [Microbacterium sp. zg.Y843]MCR2815392.1 TetR/AcrR family transcriptional regulator [Microbacterium sp. zg.Y843]